MLLNKELTSLTFLNQKQICFKDIERLINFFYSRLFINNSSKKEVRGELMAKPVFYLYILLLKIEKSLSKTNFTKNQ